MPMASGVDQRAVRTGSNSATAVVSGGPGPCLAAPGPQAGQDPADLLQVAWHAPPAGLRDLAAPDAVEHPVEPVGGHPVVEDVIDRHHRSLVAGGQAFLLLHGDQPALLDP